MTIRELSFKGREISFWSIDKTFQVHWERLPCESYWLHLDPPQIPGVPGCHFRMHYWYWKLWNVSVSVIFGRLRNTTKLDSHCVFTAKLATSSALVLFNTECYLQKFYKVASNNMFLEQQNTKNKKKKQKTQSASKISWRCVI